MTVKGIEFDTKGNITKGAEHMTPKEKVIFAESTKKIQQSLKANALMKKLGVDIENVDEGAYGGRGVGIAREDYAYNNNYPK